MKSKSNYNAAVNHKDNTNAFAYTHTINLHRRLHLNPSRNSIRLQLRRSVVALFGFRRSSAFARKYEVQLALWLLGRA
jgi:hypothetical protein